MWSYVGYGDYYPVTWEGKLFFIFYALFTISMVIVVLAKCGDILTSINNILCNALLKFFPKMKEKVSSEALNTVLMLLMNILYLHIGVGLKMTENGWSYIDSIYFQVVTFTTVGFGDQLLPYKRQNELMPYRLVGLSLVAGFIDAASKWVKRRKEKLTVIVADRVARSTRKKNSVENSIMNEKVDLNTSPSGAV